MSIIRGPLKGCSRIRLSLNNMIFNLSFWNKKKEVENFLDYPAGVQKRLVGQAVRGANEMQLAMVKDYERDLKKRRR